MRKVALCLLLVALLVSPTLASDWMASLKTSLQVSFAVMEWTDLSLSYVAVRNGWAREGNALGRYLLARPALAITVSIGRTAGFLALTDAAYKQNRTLGLIAICLAVIIKGFALAHNFSVIRGR